MGGNVIPFKASADFSDSEKKKKIEVNILLKENLKSSQKNRNQYLHASNKCFNRRFLQTELLTSIFNKDKSNVTPTKLPEGQK